MEHYLKCPPEHEIEWEYLEDHIRQCPYCGEYFAKVYQWETGYTVWEPGYGYRPPEESEEVTSMTTEITPKVNNAFSFYHTVPDPVFERVEYFIWYDGEVYTIKLRADPVTQTELMGDLGYIRVNARHGGTLLSALTAADALLTQQSETVPAARSLIEGFAQARQTAAKLPTPEA